MPRGRTRVPEIRKGDTVLLLHGKDAGKQGVVERVVTNSAALSHVAPLSGGKSERSRRGFWKPASARPVSVVVEGLNIAKRHTKPRQVAGRTDRQPRIQQGGILEIAQPMNASNVMVICPACSEPTRIRHDHVADGRSVRVCANCGEPLARAERNRS